MSPLWSSASLTSSLDPVGWGTLVAMPQLQPWFLVPLSYQGPSPMVALHPLTGSARKGRMGVPVGKDPIRASVGVQRTKERDISRKFLLPQNQCSYLPSSHDLLGHPSRSTCKHVPEKCQRWLVMWWNVFINLLVLTDRVGDGKGRPRLHVSEQGSDDRFILLFTFWNLM